MMPTSMERVISEIDGARRLGGQGIIWIIYMDSDVTQDGSKRW